MTTMSLLAGMMALAFRPDAAPPAGGASVQGPMPPSAPVEMPVLRSGEVRQLRVGQSFAVALTEHPSAGYTWEAADTPDIVHADGVTEPDFADLAPGGDIGDKLFRFTARHPGAATLRFVHVFRGERREEVSYHVIVTG